MIIRCPQCRTGYSVEHDQIHRTGRTVRCSHCSHTWQQEYISKVESEPELKKPPIAPINSTLDNEIADNASAAVKNKKTLQMIALGAFISITLVLSGILLAQNFFENLFPASKGFYSAIGLSNDNKEMTQSSTGLIIPKNAVERTLEDGEPLVLTFKGKVVNTNSVSVSVPKIIVTLHDEKGVEIDRWPAYPEKSKLEAGEETTWTCRFFNPEIDSVFEHRIRFTN
ncbi:MAG: putative Zn finger-like uncharacterized protein [Alphaproteobacteria bacterium]|jgi:predicted Zn finger-like uncharacterized protein